jgi:hypothetical protein
LLILIKFTYQVFRGIILLNNLSGERYE